MALAERAKLIAELSLEDKLSKGLGTATKNVGKFEKGIGRTGKGVVQFGKGAAKVAIVAGAAIATGLAVATKTAIDFDDAFASVAKNAENASTGQLKDLNDQLHALATRIPVGFQDLTGIAAEAGALGVATPDIARFTETVARLSAATQGLSPEAAAEAFGKFKSILHLSIGDLQRSASSLVELGRSGASSEADIIEVAKRFAGAGKTAGLSAAQILGLSSAIESLGVAPEAAGGSLSRLFNNLNKYIGTGDKKLKAFAGTAGLTTKQFARSFQKDALGTFEKFLAGLKKLKGPEQAKVLKEAGVSNVRDISALQLLAQSYGLVATQVDQSTKAFKDNTAVTDVSNKRFDTLKNQVTLLRQNVSEAAYNLAKGFTPALTRAVTKLTAFLQLPSNKKDLEEIGQKLGKTLDKIDFDRLLKSAKSAVDVLQPMVDVLVGIANALNALPTEVKGVALGAVVANKVSGGALSAGAGNVVGGLAETLTKSLASKIPVFGKAFVQPVFVTNIGAGGGLGSGGAPGAPGGGAGSKLAKLGAVAAIGFDIAAVVATQQEISAQSSAQGDALKAQLASGIKVQTPQQLQTSLAAVEQGINDLQANPLNVLVQGSALDSLKSMRADLQAQIAAGTKPTDVLGKGFGAAISGAITKALPQLKLPGIQSALQKNIARLATLQHRLHTAKESGDKGRAAALKGRVDRLSARIDAEKRQLAGIQTQTKNVTKTGLNSLGGIERTGSADVVGAMNSAAGSIVGAIYAARPVINATTIVRSTVRNGRAGPSGGSSNTNRLDSGHGP